MIISVVLSSVYLFRAHFGVQVCPQGPLYNFAPTAKSLVQTGSARLLTGYWVDKETQPRNLSVSLWGISTDLQPSSLMSSSGSLSSSWLHWSAWILQAFLLLLKWRSKPSPQTTKQCMVHPSPLPSALGCRKLQSSVIPSDPQRNQLLPSQCAHALRVLAHTAPTCASPQWLSSWSWSRFHLPASAYASSPPCALLWPASGDLNFLLYSMWLSHNTEDIRLCVKHRCS